MFFGRIINLLKFNYERGYTYMKEESIFLITPLGDENSPERCHADK